MGDLMTVPAEPMPSRYCLGCDYDLRSLPAGACPECGRPFDPEHARSFRAQPRGEAERIALRTSRPVALITLAGAAVIAAWLSATGFDTIMLLFGSCVVVCGISPFVIGWALLEWRARSFRPWPILGVLLCLLAIVTTLLFHWPLRLSFALHRPALERLAAQAQAGTPPPLPTRVGLYTIRGIDATSYPGVIGLHIDTNPGGPTGFYRMTVPTPTAPANEQWAVHLDDRWWWIRED